MNKILSLCLISMAVFFLPACLWKKKNTTDSGPVSAEYIEMEKKTVNDEGIEVGSFDEKDDLEEYVITNNKIKRESIFEEEDNEKEEENLIDQEPAKGMIKKHIKRDVFSIEESVEMVENKHKYGTVFFGFNKKQFQAESKQEAQKIVKELKAMIHKGKVKEIIIEGHACNSSGSYRYNMQISGERAQNFKNYLIESGIDGTLIKTVGYGILNLIVKTGNRDEQAENRRVEVFTIN